MIKNLVKKENIFSSDENKQMLENIICKEFPKFIEKQNNLRSEYIHWNRYIKKSYKKKKISVQREEKEVEISETTHLKLNPNLTIPQGIFVYPCSDNFRTEEKYVVEYLPKVDSFSKFKEILENVSSDLEEAYEDYPRNKEESEKIENVTFIFWVIIKFFQTRNLEFPKLLSLIEDLSSIFKKKPYCLYKEISYYFKSRFKSFSLQRAEIEIFRKSYCEVCFDYLCKKHFFSGYILSSKDKINLNNQTLTKSSSLPIVLRDNSINKKDDYISSFIQTENIYNLLQAESFHTSEIIDLTSDVPLQKYIPTKKKCISQMNKIQNNLHTLPCFHPGPCTKETCECLIYRGACEKFCGCRFNCTSQYVGCSCVGGCGTSQFSSCPCVTNKRECDPDICSCCPSPSTKHFCSNQNICRRLTKKTCLAKSHLCASLGLFALEDISRGDYICEYLGELLTKEETDRRSIFNNQMGLNYLFSLNGDTDIDAYRIGNQMRYANHSAFGFENCSARTIYVRGEIRIALYADGNIKKGEELFFDYQINSEAPWLIKYNRYYGVVQGN